MNRVFFCLRDHHDWPLVGLAALICLLASGVTLVALNRARAFTGLDRLRWIAASGAVGGFGIFATHFIAMLAYHAGVPMTFDLTLTLLSLVCAMGLTAAGAEIATSRSSSYAAAAGGGVIGAGIGVMHYLGMMAVDVPGEIHWAWDLVITSVVVGIVFGGAAMAVFERGGRWSLPGAAGLLLLAIVSHHFTAMGAVSVIADPFHHATGLHISPASMSVILAIASIGCLSLCALAERWGSRLDAIKANGDKRFRVLLDNVTDYGIILLDADGVVTDWSGGATRVKGYDPAEMIGRRLTDPGLMGEAEARRHAEWLEKARTHDQFETEFQGRRKGGGAFWGHVVVTTVHDAEGGLMGFAYVMRDITTQKADKERMLDMSRNLDAALSHMSQGLCLFDRNGKLILANGRFAEIYGLPEDVVVPGISFHDLMITVMTLKTGTRPDDDVIDAYAARHRALLAQPGGGSMISEFFTNRFMSITHRPMPGGGWVSTFDDVSEQRATEQRIAHMARHDGLTGLPNRLHFNEYLDQDLAWASRHGEEVAVVVVDLDGFKELNERSGHSAGDAILKILGERLAELTAGDGRFVARLGGDEFAAVKRFEDAEAVEACVRKLYDCIRAPMEVDGDEVRLEASLGVAMFPRDGISRETLVNNADLALGRAKASGQAGKVCFYEAEMDEAARERRALAKDLVTALKNDEFRVFYQVQKSVKTGGVTGYEALIRWKHPVRGFVSPAEFIGVAEESGAIVDIGAWVLKTAVREAAGWTNGARIAVNLSPVQLKDVDLIDTVREVLAETGLSPSRLELEITESTIIDDRLTALHILRQIKALGVTIAIDDFGTGYASLDTLNAFPFDKIKIDRGFLMEADRTPQARAIVRAILALGKSLEIPVLAEGVETEAQLNLLREEGCEEAQGYLLGRPAEEIAAEVRKAS
jgi:diguanylate cyclase (GGDEF)-like protein/PAS domain S-box-containing protein